MGNSIRNNQKLLLFILVLFIYTSVNFLEAYSSAPWNFDNNFKAYLPLFLAYLTIDLLGGDVVAILKTTIDYFKK